MKVRARFRFHLGTLRPPEGNCRVPVWKPLHSFPDMSSACLQRWGGTVCPPETRSHGQHSPWPGSSSKPCSLPLWTGSRSPGSLRAVLCLLRGGLNCSRQRPVSPHKCPQFLPLCPCLWSNDLLPVGPQCSQAGVLLKRPLRTDAAQLACSEVKDGACIWATQEARGS